MEVVQHAETWLNAHPPGLISFGCTCMIRTIRRAAAAYSEIYKDRLYDGEIAYADSALVTSLLT